MSKEEQVPQEGEFKMKKKRGRPRKLANKKDDAIKVELNKKEEDAVQEPVTENSVPSAGEESKEERKEAEVELQPVGETHSEEQTSSDSTTATRCCCPPDNSLGRRSPNLASPTNSNPSIAFSLASCFGIWLMARP